MKEVLKYTAGLFAMLGTGIDIASFFNDGGVYIFGVITGIWVMLVGVLIRYLSTLYEDQEADHDQGTLHCLYHWHHGFRAFALAPG